MVIIECIRIKSLGNYVAAMWYILPAKAYPASCKSKPNALKGKGRHNASTAVARAPLYRLSRFVCEFTQEGLERLLDGNEVISGQYHAKVRV